tara:strand:- start:105 stop:407 length:303 start_codon:yes stop_codon:yes gene_type:complete
MIRIVLAIIMLVLITTPVHSKQDIPIICTTDLLGLEKEIEGNGEIFVWEGKSLIGIDFRFYVGPETWTVLFFNDMNGWCTGPAFNGKTTALQKEIPGVGV